MDHAEWQAAYRRATMDDGTMRDYIEDLMLQRDALNRQVGDLEAEVARLSESEQRYASDYLRWRKLAERLNGLLRSLEAERDRLQAQLRELSERFSAQEAKHYRIIRSLEAERDQWQRQAMTNG